ncbi:hypothetical protein AAC387_Pa01g2677 [Persea americana]|eukprot:TRINITY_DN505_c0_g1_i1.p1 TRINITY_DN505_c0_g1~~TRINITY_DN505_c0_g1_i1.p1  ORF type:complete len:108 (+),score=43.62 TRINITY_DN505_c0_g1_i1:981-1304(+)
MGNCMETSTCSYEEEIQQQREQKQEERAAAEQEQEKGGFVKAGSFRMKLLLTKEELEWLLFQLKEKGGKRLEDVLVEMESGKGRNEGWKPSLESITESPEIQTVEMD